MKKTTYDPAAKETVLNLMARGWTNRQITDTPSLSHIPDNLLRTWRKRMNDATQGETPAQPKKAKVATLATQNATDATPKIPVQHSEETAKTPVKIQVEPGFWKKCVANFHPADLVYYTCVAIALHPIVATLQDIGKPVAAIVASVAFVALQGIKSETGWKRATHLALFGFFEVVFFALHFSWANNALWANVSALPLTIYRTKFRDNVGDIVHLYQGSDLEIPFYIAIGIAVVMLVCSVYVVAIAVQAAKERAKNQSSNQPETAQNV